MAISISGLEEIQNSGEEAIIDLLESRIENGERTFLNGLSMGIYGDGSTANSIGGLQLLIATTPNVGTVGGIDRSQWPFFRNISYSALTNGGAAANAANILSYMDSLWVQLIRGRDAPDLIVADNNMYKYYLQALQSIQRITTEGAAPELAEAGFQSLKYMSSDVVLDGGYQGQTTDPLPYKVSTDTSAVGGAPTNTMYFLKGSVTIH